ncbi:hypothetical protein [Haloarchaeobius sp. HME9146]|uniref:hypothetical protein n=1 Tax=Haloarchaeobius sp. HME9146 TaxID=2978732 RepID=UPI0021BE7C7E|nr:hypothetical protein [Haloarchaeobius sp. HME9146]MCT9096955.1 hypothetical protein [Haloarchaeobius sp. HME9146]
MFETGDDFDKKKNRVPNASAVSRANNYFVLHKGGRDGYKLHIVDKHRLVATESPNGNLVIFNGWKSYFTGFPHPVAKAAWDRLKERRHTGVQGKPIARLTVTKTPDSTPPHKLPRDRPRSGTVSLQNNKVIATTEDSGVTNVLSGLDAVTIEYRGISSPTTDQSQNPKADDNEQNTASSSTTTRSIPSSAVGSYPELARLFNHEAYDSYSKWPRYLYEHSDDRVLQQFVAELLSVLGYETSEVGELDLYHDVTAQKEGRQIRVKIFLNQTIDEIDIELCESQANICDITAFFVITVDTDLTDRAQFTGWSDDIRVIDSKELYDLVKGAVLRISETT